ncbi:hypothetical protein EJ02DRAFT_169647 [Clathrospora elynae]|uniref:Uncharacterized protein n=1 Tax=Clathrospora elynae TaxID=706981 RepID=A0A6A5S3L6_9PLEO|nr:hypothetical protein EJ02DRAFT_169647 [Clathrospora elynae]
MTVRGFVLHPHPCGVAAIRLCVGPCAAMCGGVERCHEAFAVVNHAARSSPLHLSSKEICTTRVSVVPSHAHRRCAQEHDRRFCFLGERGGYLNWRPTRALLHASQSPGHRSQIYRDRSGNIDPSQPADRNCIWLSETASPVIGILRGELIGFRHIKQWHPRVCATPCR